MVGAGWLAIGGKYDTTVYIKFTSYDVSWLKKGEDTRGSIPVNIYHLDGSLAAAQASKRAASSFNDARKSLNKAYITKFYYICFLFLLFIIFYLFNKKQKRK